MQKKQSCVGFTLLEVMLAMVLLSIMVVLLFSSLRISAESWDKGESKIAEVNTKAVVYHFFKRYIPVIRPLWNDFSESDRTLSFQGGRDEFSFVSVFSASADRKGLQLFEIKFDKAEKDIKVVLTPFYPTIENAEWKREEVILLENVEKFKVSYFAKEDFDSNGSWVSNWQGKNNLPLLIKIKITLQDQSFWPEMIFALKITPSDIDDEQNDFSEALDFEL